MRKFEYMVLDVSRNTFAQDEEMLNEHGSDGWELVGVTDKAVYLKREETT